MVLSRKRGLMLILPFLLVVFSCSDTPVSQRKIMAFSDDGSRSMKTGHVKIGREFNKAAINMAKDGDIIALLSINSSSFDYECLIREIPVSFRYIDPQHKKLVEAIKDTLMAYVDSLPVGYAYYTDVLGMLVMATQVFSRADASFVRYLIIISDLESNVERKNIMDKINLKGVNIYVFFASHKFKGIADDTEAWQAKKKFWEELFHAAGAAEVHIFDASLSKLEMDRLLSRLKGI